MCVCFEFRVPIQLTVNCRAGYVVEVVLHVVYCGAALFTVVLEWEGRSLCTTDTSEKERLLSSGMHASADFSFQRWARWACKTWIGTLMLAFNILSSLTEHASDLIAWLTLLSTSIYLLNIPSHRPRKPDSSTSNIYLAISDCNHSFQPKTIVSSHV